MVVETHFTPLHFNSLASFQFDIKYIQNITRVTVNKANQNYCNLCVKLIICDKLYLFMIDNIGFFLCVRNLCIRYIIKEN